MKLTVIKNFILISAVVLAGCAGLGNDERMTSLDATTDNYRNAIRWGLYDVADKLRPADDSGKKSPDLERLKKIRVTDYKSVNKDISEDGTEARQTVEIRYYHMDYMIEKVLIDKQLWKYDPKTKMWHLKSGLPDFK
jgi:phage major head subunit gpT-like protein